MKSIHLTAALCIWSSHLLWSQSTQQFTLSEAQSYALQHNYQLQQSKLDLDIARSKVRETTAIGLPQVNGEVTYNNFIDIPTQVIPASAFGGPEGVYVPAQFGLPQSMSAGLTASQLIFDGSYFVGLQAAKQFVKASELSITQSEIEVKTSVAQAYFNALAAEENISALKENKLNIDQIFKETTALYEAGFIEKQDADQVRLLRSNITNQLDFAERQRTNILEMLKFQMGIPSETELGLTDNIANLVSSQSDNSISLLDQTFTPSKTIELQRISQGMTLSELSLKNTQAKNLPQLSAFFTHSQNAYRDDFDFLADKKWYPTTLWGVKLSVPIFSSFYRAEGTKQAKLELAKLQSQKTQLEQSMAMQAMSAKNQYSSSLARYQTVKEDLELAKSIKDRTRIKYNEGLASSVDLTTAEAQYLTTLGNYINTTLELLNAKLNLDKALGNY